MKTRKVLGLGSWVLGLVLIALQAFGQGTPIATTGFTRTMLRGADSAAVRATLGFLTTNNTVITNYTGNGASITNLNADELRSGTVPLPRLTGITAAQVADATLTTNKVDATFHALLGGGGSGDVTQAGLSNAIYVVNGLRTTNFVLGMTYYSSNLVFSGSDEVTINGTYNYLSAGNYVNGDNSTCGFNPIQKYYVSTEDGSISFTNATGLVGATWYPYDGSASAPTSVFVGSSNFTPSRVYIAATFLTTNTQTIYVDATYGNDWNWMRGRPDMPLQTLSMLERVILPGDEVFLQPGNYTNSVIYLASEVSFSGSGMNKTFIWPESGVCVLHSSNNFSMSDMTWNGSIYIDSASTNTLIQRVRTYDPSDGIYNTAGVGVFLDSCVLKSGWDCIANFSTNANTVIRARNCDMESTGATFTVARGVYNDGAGLIEIIGGKIKVRTGGVQTACIVNNTNAPGSITATGVYFDFADPPGQTSYAAQNFGTGRVTINGKNFPQSRMQGNLLYVGDESFSTNYTAAVANTVGLTNTTTRTEVWNIYGTSGTLAFHNRTAVDGATVCGVSVWTNTVTATGSDYIVGPNCGIKIYTGVGTIISRRILQ